MIIKNIASSSEANCTHIQGYKSNILIDVGTNLKNVKDSIGKYTPIDAIFITHDHSDHWGGLGVVTRFYSKLTSKKIDIYIHPYCWDAIKDKKGLGKVEGNILTLDPTDEYTVKDFTIKPFSVVHDAAYAVGFTIKQKDGKKLGYLTDTGSFTKLIEYYLKDCDALIIEADYDEEKLANYAEYDQFLKDRISSSLGHLSNQQTLEFLEKIGINNKQFIMFAHLSKNTNSPDLILSQAKERFPNYNNFTVAPNITALQL